MNRLSAHIHGWLLFLPAAVLLAAFTHYPAVATLWHSFLSTPKGDRPAVWVGLDNYQGMVEDPVFWQVLANNLWFALGTIPVSIALAMLMAVWVNGKLAGRGFLPVDAARLHAAARFGALLRGLQAIIGQ